MLLILAAVPFETSLLRRQLLSSQNIQLGNYTATSGTLYGQPVMIAHGGIGPSTMAMQLTRIFAQQAFVAVLHCGCGGSYQHSGLHNGDLAMASAEVFGDLGVVTADTFIPLAELDISQDDQRVPSSRQNYSLQSPLLDFARNVLPTAVVGSFVTVSGCSGHSGLSDELESRWGGICENMEGAAVAQVCAEFSVPLLELRGISNPTGSRDPQEWELKRGAEAAQQGLLQLLERWSEYRD